MNTPVFTPVSSNVIVLAFESGDVEGVTVAKSAFFTVTVRLPFDEDLVGGGAQNNSC